jgi:hypothetical protein
VPSFVKVFRGKLASHIFGLSLRFAQDHIMAKDAILREATDVGTAEVVAAVALIIEFSAPAPCAQQARIDRLKEIVRQDMTVVRRAVRRPLREAVPIRIH